MVIRKQKTKTSKNSQWAKQAEQQYQLALQLYDEQQTNKAQKAYEKDLAQLDRAQLDRHFVCTIAIRKSAFTDL